MVRMGATLCKHFTPCGLCPRPLPNLTARHGDAPLERRKEQAPTPGRPRTLGPSSEVSKWAAFSLSLGALQRAASAVSPVEGSQLAAVLGGSLLQASLIFKARCFGTPLAGGLKSWGARRRVPTIRSFQIVGCFKNSLKLWPLWIPCSGQQIFP